MEDEVKSYRLISDESSVELTELSHKNQVTEEVHVEPCDKTK